MRVIAGSARRLMLKTVEGMETRPTTDRIKETLFNMIQNDLYEATFLDLFSGSGAIGIEALSRGAKSAVFVENNKRAVSCIRENLAATRLSDRAEVFACDAFAGLEKLEGTRAPFSYVFMDPPYRQEHEKRILAYLKNSDLLDADTAVIVESSLDTEFPYLEEYGYEIVRIKEYKTNKHLFLRRR